MEALTLPVVIYKGIAMNQILRIFIARSTYAVLYQEDYTSEHMYISNLHIKIIGAFSKTQAITVEIMF